MRCLVYSDAPSITNNVILPMLSCHQYSANVILPPRCSSAKCYSATNILPMLFCHQNSANVILPPKCSAYGVLPPKFCQCYSATNVILTICYSTTRMFCQCYSATNVILTICYSTTRMFCQCYSATNTFCHQASVRPNPL